MLQRIATDGGLVYYQSPLLAQFGVRHAFSTRLGGISSAPFNSLNLGNPTGGPQDDWENIRQNYRILQEAIGCGSSDRCWVHQVHGDGVVAAACDLPWESGAKADAMVTNDPGRVLSVRTADCTPILLADSTGRFVSAIHAGWRGVIAGVVPRSVDALRDLSDRPRHIPIIAAIGPAISFDVFEVSTDVLEQFRVAFGSTVCRDAGGGKGFVNLQAAITQQLRLAGVEQIDQTDQCTYSNQAEFFSHRRDNGITGRMASLIAPRETGSRRR